MRKALAVLFLSGCFVQGAFCAEFNMFLNPGLIVATQYGDEKNEGHWGPSILIGIEPHLRLSNYISLGIGISQMFLNERDTPNAHVNFTRFYFSSKFGRMEIFDASKLAGIAKIGVSAYNEKDNYLVQDLGKTKAGLFWGAGLELGLINDMGIEVLYSQDVYYINEYKTSSRFVSLSLVYKLL